MSEEYSEAEIERSQGLIEQVLGPQEVAKLQAEAVPERRPLTNVLGLPEPIVRAVTKDKYSKGRAEFSVTELLLPPRVRALRRRYRNQIVEDVADVIYRLVGKLGHSVLELAGQNSADIVERRFFATVAHHLISGQSDLIWVENRWSGYDYKFTSMWTVKDGPKPDWIAQLNILRLLAWRDAKLEVNELSNIAIYRDWSKRQARRALKTGEYYPQQPVGVFPVPIWTHEETEAFVAARIALHQAAEKNLPECSAEERWAKPDTWKVKKSAESSRAVKGGVFDSEFDAVVRAAQKPGLVVVHEPAESIRCQDYCDVADFCTQYQHILHDSDPPI